MSAPLVVNTRDGVCWTRRTVTSGGVALYALADVCSCPTFVMATLPELAARGIVGTADALPMPVAPAPDADDHDDAAYAAEVAEGALEGQGYKASAVVKSVDEEQVAVLRARVAELEAERHSTNESLSDAAVRMRADRDRIAELEDKKELADRERVELQTGLERALAPFCADPAVAARAAAEVRHYDAAWFQRDAQRLMDRVAELEARLGEYERPVDEDPIPFALTEQAPAAGGDVTPQVQKLRALLAGQREQAGGPDEWCTGCTTDHNPDECGYRPGAGDAS